jgi:SAM-dependent methyltransferase
VALDALLSKARGARFSVLRRTSVRRLCYMDALRSRGFNGGSLLDLSMAPADLAPAAYDAAIMLDQLQAQPAPGELLRGVWAALRPGAPLLLTVPLGRRRTRWRPEDRWYFDETTIQLLLLRHGFHQVLTRKLASGMLVTAVRDEPPARPKCSILVAAFNENRTFPVLMDALLKKEIPGVDREIVVIESNSTDGTRESAKLYQNRPEIKLVLQDRPRGKGHALREGFRHATGDIVLIQDADLEYDLDDYNALLAPILSYRSLFVLGTRHAGNWKIRQFARQKVLSTGLNIGHAFFTGLINVLFRQNMTDPFTMFKVFRRDCLFGLEFQCNRFDFDHELVIKFVRKGYRPLEIPVNYCSRSFREGKKVRLFRDPFTWLWVDLKLRFARALPKDLY